MLRIGIAVDALVITAVTARSASRAAHR